ncbi:MAG TPA: NUDIX hydrolase [Steroidobacteraceae bacterium]|nr:NUDIX hydrolase [Steroidobacteraceae bacterium]
MNPLHSTQKFQGRVIRVSVDDVQLPNGLRTQLEVVHHPGGAAVVSLDAQERVCLLRQYRYVADGWVWELPAGKLEPAEPPLATAQRELEEEAGLRAAHWSSLGAIFSSPGVFSEVLHLFLARELTQARAAPEANEVFEVHWVSLHEACERALDGDIRDGKTALGLLRAAHQLRAPAHRPEI